MCTATVGSITCKLICCRQGQRRAAALRADAAHRQQVGIVPTVLIGHVYLAADRWFDPGCTIITCMAAFSEHLPRNCCMS